MPRRRTLLGADVRVFLLKAKGHEIHVTSSRDFATVIVWHKSGCKHAVTLRPADLDQAVRDSVSYRRFPQSVLVAQAIHAAIDLSEEEHA